MLPLDGMARPTNRRSPRIFISRYLNITMARTKAPKSKKGAKKRAYKPRVRKAARNVKNVSEYASLSETRSFVSTGPGGNTVNQLMSLMNIQLTDFTRAPLVAQAYQHYRIKYVKVIFKSPFDTYVSGSGGLPAYRKPYLYHMIDKAGAVPTNITLEGLKQMGAKPRAFDERQLTVGWRPSVLLNAMTAGGGAPTSQGSEYKISPWLNTSDTSVGSPWNPSSVDHLGLYWYMEAQADGVDPPQFNYLIDIEVQFEFKKPLIATTVGNAHAVPIAPAKLDASPDGVEGGSDGITIPLTT